MRGGKDEESKAMGPMFPRLHVNDTNKGGPRAPPRNKMALYEQLSVPSQRFTSSSSGSTRPQQIGGTSFPSNSSSQKGDGAQEKPFFSSFNVPRHASTHSSDKVNCQSTEAPHTSSTGADPEKRPIKLARREVLSLSKQSSAPGSGSRQTKEASKKEACSKKPIEDDDFMVPTLYNQSKATEKVLLGQESGGKSGKIFRPLPKFSSENGSRNTKMLERGEGCSNSEKEKGERKEGRGREELEASQDGFTEEAMLGISISPDDVVNAIGHKTFWKARRLIVNQQRVFAVQVFELHRLIKVQQLIAASPAVLQSDLLVGKKPPAPIKPVPAIDSNLIGQSQGSRHADEPQMIKNVPECSKEITAVDNNNSNQEEPLPSHEEAPEHSQVRSATAVNSAVLPMASEKKPGSSCCLPPAPSQWLVPVMSPSEGLVYKPYSGLYPPAGSFMSPLFPGCAAPVHIPAATGDFMNSAYGVPVPMQVPVPPHPPQNMGMVGLPNYFPPFSMQVMNQNPGVITNSAMIPNPLMSASAVEQGSRLVASKPDGPEHVEQHSRGSCNMAQLKSDAFSGCMWGFRTSKDSELQGSTASSPFDRGDALTLFQMGSASVDTLPKVLPTGGAGNITHVIKVVPHNPRLATESAARIFQSIQKEREQNET